MRRIISILFIVIVFSTKGGSQDFYKAKKVEVSTRQDWELAAVPYGGGIVFVSNKSSASAVDYRDQDKNKFSNIFYVEDNGDGHWGVAKSFSSNIKSNYHDGPVTFSADEQTICYAQAYVAELGEMGRRNNPNSGLYFADFENEEWVNIRPFEHNDFDYTYTSPHLSADGLSLYFSANLAESRGGLDLYVSRKQSNGTWSLPENLGNEINTSEDDVFPFWHSASKRLYFSSKGHDAFGGSDVFYSQYYNSEWGAAVKLPEPINSGADDYTLIMSDDFSSGYFTSKRGGQTPDIYRFETSFPTFTLPREIQRNRFCYRLRENSLDTIDYEVFDYEWVINDTLKLAGHNIRYCFPGPGDYEIHFNVYNKLTDTAMLDVANMFLPLRYIEQAVITSPDTVLVNVEFALSASDSYLPQYEIDSYYWDYGDGMKDSGLEVRKSFSVPGTYKVVLGLVEKLDRNADWEPEKFAVFKEIVVLPDN